MPKKTVTISPKTLAVLSVLLLAAGLLPLCALSFSNHPFYDDFGFSLLTRAAWKETGRVWDVIAAAWRNTTGIRHTWEGTYTTSFVSALQPAVFGEGYYWVTAFALLGSLLLSLWFFLRQALTQSLKTNRSAFTVTFCGLAFLMTQFPPDAAEAFFWFNGGAAYTLMWALLLFTAGLWLKLAQARGKVKTSLLFAAALALTALVGGGKYSLLLPAGLLAIGFSLWAFRAKRPKRWLFFALTLALLGCLAFNASAPGNAVRAKTLQGGMSAPMAVAQSFYFGLALMGTWFSLPLAGALLLSALLLAPAIRESEVSFAHPVWATLLTACLFCAQLTPTLFTGNYLGDGRVLNTYYYTYVLMACFLVIYWMGWGMRKKAAPAHVAPAGDGKSPALPAVAIAVLLAVVGCVSYHPEGVESYGPQNMAGGSAALSLLRGEAQAYDRAMDARDAALNDPARSSVALAPVRPIPRLFMSDALDSPALDYVLSLYAEYYQKESVVVREP